MSNKLTITKRDIQSLIVEYSVAFGHIPGMTKWLHFVYDIGAARLTYRLKYLSRSQEQVLYFDDLDQAIEAYNKQ